MTKLNLILWGISLTLQCVLLAAFFWRGVARRIPIMAILIGFYIVRSTASYTIFRHLRGSSYALLSGSMAVVDVVLQTLVAWVLFSAAEHHAGEAQSSDEVRRDGSQIVSAGSSVLGRLAMFSVFLIAAAGLAAFGSTLIRTNPRVPVDRSILFVSMVYLMVFLATVAKRASPLIRSLVGGFGFYAGASIVCQIGRAVAGAQRSVTAFNWWSYGEPAAYLGVVLFWIVVLSRMRRTENSSVVVSY
jgi:hypothetical protein